jgi:hypothetical protein
MKKYVVVLLAIAGFLVAAPRALAQTNFPLIVNGSPGLRMDYTNGLLTVSFRRTLRGAGQPDTYIRNVPPGAGSWVDRPINSQEPLTVKQTMNPDQATAAMDRLRQNGGYWRFYCHNTNHGYFEAVRSERADASVLID